MGKVKVKIKAAVGKIRDAVAKKGVYRQKGKLTAHLTYENGERRK